MKKGLLFLYLMVQATSCFNFQECNDEDKLVVSNLSDRAIYVNISNIDFKEVPNLIDSDTIYNSYDVTNKKQVTFYAAYESRPFKVKNCFWEHVKGDNSIYAFYFFDAAQVDTLGWDSIWWNFMYLDRIFVTYEKLDSMNWMITWPINEMNIGLDCSNSNTQSIIR